MAGADGGAGHQAAQGIGGLDLSHMTAQGVDARIEGGVGALGRLGGERPGDQGRLVKPLRLEQPGQGIGGGELGAVQEGQPLLGAQFHRLQPGGVQGFRRRVPFVPDEDLALADQGGGHVRQGGQVAAGPDGALTGDHGDQLALQHGLQQVGGLRPHAGRALGEAGQLQGHHQPDDIAGGGGPGSRRMAQHDVALQPSEVRVPDPHIGELAEAGIDSIDRRAGGQNARDRGRAGSDHRPGGGVELRRRAEIDGPPVAEGHGTRLQCDDRHFPLQTRRYSGLKPMR